jgi:hemoglobin
VSATFYEIVGGEAGVRRLVDRFYELMDTLPEAKTVRAVHPPSLESAREKLFLFMSGWLGGPSLYIEKYGHPRLRARHLPFAVDAQARDEWMLCMTRALAEVCTDEDARAKLTKGLADLATHMINR